MYLPNKLVINYYILYLTFSQSLFEQDEDKKNGKYKYIMLLNIFQHINCIFKTSFI